MPPATHNPRPERPQKSGATAVAVAFYALTFYSYGTALMDYLLVYSRVYYAPKTIDLC